VIILSIGSQLFFKANGYISRHIWLGGGVTEVEQVFTVDAIRMVQVFWSLEAKGQNPVKSFCGMCMAPNDYEDGILSLVSPSPCRLTPPYPLHSRIVACA